MGTGILFLVGCAPGTPDEDSWRGDAGRAVSDVASAVQTAQLALSQAARGQVPDRYLRTVLLDAERTGGTAAQTLSATQPPDVERRRAGDVDDELEKATGLLTDARIAVVAHDESGLADLVDQLRGTADDLTHLETELEHPPTEAEGGS